MSKRYKYFTVTGVANATVEDNGFSSTPEETRKLVGIYIYTTGWADNRIVVHYDLEKVLEIPDFIVHTDEGTGGANTQQSVTVPCFFPLDIDVAVGKQIKVGITCGATNEDLRGAYVYEI